MNPAFDAEVVTPLPHGVSLCHVWHGAPQHPVVVLIAGLGLQWCSWPPELIQGLVDRGFRVLCLDNRDVGRSSRLDTPHPSRWQQLKRQAPEGAYSLDDMADDVHHLLQHLSVQAAHVVGMSMGGMIAQQLAARHPSQVLSLTSIFSNTGHPRHGQPAFSSLWRMARTRAPRTEAQAVANFSAMMEHIGDASAPGARQRWAEYAARAWHRSGQRVDARAFFRQLGAVMKSGNRTRGLSRITAPTLVVHGDVDRMVHPSGGMATAKAIAGAQLHIIPGMRHQIDGLQAQRLLTLLVPHLQQAGGAA